MLTAALNWKSCFDAEVRHAGLWRSEKVPKVGERSSRFSNRLCHIRMILRQILNVTSSKPKQSAEQKERTQKNQKDDTHGAMRPNVERSHAGPTTLECNRDGLPALAGASGSSRACRRLGRRLAGGQMEKPLSLYPSPHSFLVGRGNIISGRVYPGWRSFLAYPGLLSYHSYGVSVWLAALANRRTID